MNTNWKSDKMCLIGFLICFCVFMACNNSANNHSHEEATNLSADTLYTCPMHAEIIRSKPGNCPLCNMLLEPVEVENLMQSNSPNKQVLSNQSTIRPVLTNAPEYRTAEGYIVPDFNRNISVAARFGGRVEKLYVKYNNIFIEKGAKIMDIYSPEIRTYQEEHLFLLESKADPVLIEKSRVKLLYLGLSEAQIRNLEQIHKVAISLTVFSPAKGFVTFKDQNLGKGNETKPVMPAGGMSMATQTGNKSKFSDVESQIREGMYIDKEQILYTLNDLDEVWGMIYLPNDALNQISANQKVEIVNESNPALKILGKITRIEYAFEEEGQRYVRLRIALPNPNKILKINSLITASLNISAKTNWHIPATAVYRTGQNAYVWVKTGTTAKGTGIFQVRKITARRSNNGMVSVISGIDERDEIALEAGLMIDSESFINSN